MYGESWDPGSVCPGIHVARYPSVWVALVPRTKPPPRDESRTSSIIGVLFRCIESITKVLRQEVRYRTLRLVGSMEPLWWPILVHQMDSRSLKTNPCEAHQVSKVSFLPIATRFHRMLATSSGTTYDSEIDGDNGLRDFGRRRIFQVLMLLLFAGHRRYSVPLFLPTCHLIRFG